MKRIIKQLKRELKKANGGDGGREGGEREETHRREREEMREICEGETRDEEERKPDEGDSPHRGLKARTRRNFERHVEERRRANHAEEKLPDVCVNVFVCWRRSD